MTTSVNQRATDYFNDSHQKSSSEDRTAGTIHEGHTPLIQRRTIETKANEKKTERLREVN